MTLTIKFTDHAVQRYRQRHAGELSFDEAKERLVGAAGSAVPLRRKTDNGQEQWRVDSLDIILVTKHDPKARVHTCVTVLPKLADYRHPSGSLAEHVENLAAEARLREASAAADLARLREAQRQAAAEATTGAVTTAVETLTRAADLPPPPSTATATGSYYASATAAAGARAKELAIQHDALRIHRAILDAELKTIRHACTTDREQHKLRRVLRIAVRHLMGILDREVAYNAITEIDGGFLSPEFFTKDC